MVAPVAPPGIADAYCPGFAASRERDIDRLFAGFLGLTGYVLTTRFAIMTAAPQFIPFFPVAIYQDVLFITAVGWTFCLLLTRVSLSKHWKIFVAAGWTICFLLTAYTSIHIVVYRLIRSPLTWRLIAISDRGGGAEPAIIEAARSSIRVVLSGFLTMAMVSAVLIRYAPNFVAQSRRVFFSARTVLLIALYLAAAHVVCRSYLWFPNLASNPELALLASFTDVARPVAAGPVPAAYLSDFEPNSHSRTAAAALLNSNSAEGPIAHPMNVLMVVMESVGARYLSACGASYADSPAIDGLAAHGISFGRIYAAQPNSSAAMTALFCSLYPDHDWLTIPRETPEVPMPGLAAVLARQGYRTGFIHIGKIDYDHQDEFLRAHGVRYIAAQAHDEGRAADMRALPLAINWIKADRARPFFLTLWTQDTHNPYVTAPVRHYGVQSAALDRYLNGIRSTDDLVARLHTMLDDNHLADSTLVVITGDHGEAFGEHGELIHGFTVYDEEVRVPLIIVNPKLITHRMTVDRVGRQIDIAPTILQLLGFDRPAGWQGESLLSAGPPRRAYLFAADGGLTFGLVDGDLKYIYQLESGRSQLYDILKDPAERHDLSSQPELSGVTAREHARVEAWISFQNRYLRSLTRN